MAPPRYGYLAAIKGQRDATGRFQRGNTVAVGNKGSRRRLEEDFVRDLCAAWRQHGKAALDIVATTEPAKFAQIAASVLPKHTNVTGTQQLKMMSDAELATIIEECEQEIRAGVPRGKDLN